ncbi:RiPP maturation radical SAM C-methyltransferase [Micromonospora sp. WMMD882]|uniref:RiPP maturation radical SAM C-methyltransferase n=1 Tax=Micromonospora sp. WMMD882 TaxID=3015151 RepID=UPI00248C84E5|nr:RiPP maturation radical SAM C-methyltransferase [Micromonospora sp. WMMD882]WBB80752.1 RiPP maturation radical SAM C-methyltransferase [Micromonospora sp. WMMD882]
MSVCLVAMPWQSLESPSLPLGLLRAAVTRAGLPTPRTYHANLRWAEFLLARTDEELGPREYTKVAEEGLFDGLGDWVFTGVLHADAEFAVDTLRDYARERDLDLTAVRRMRGHAADFVELVVDEVLATGPEVVGFSTTFMQNVPSLAVARRIRERAPDVRIVFGGGNCDGPMGAALHRNYPWVDLVVRGEGEVAFPALLAALATGGSPEALRAVPGLCWRDADGTLRQNPQPAPLPMTKVPTPDFDDWFARMEVSPVHPHVEPKLVLETARGCWWGEKHHCTFCGLNGTLMAFRAKDPDTVLTELGELTGRHRVLDVIVVDNIIDNGFFATVLPRIAELEWDLRLHYEVKSNLKPQEIAAFRAARVNHVQPGIESLVSPVLKIMDKGVAGARNVRTLRDCESAGLTVTWNWLYGFPGERLADYLPVLRQIPALMHLQPPSGTSRILLERFSPYFENPALGFPRRRTAQSYRHVYDLAEEELHDMVYLFDSPPAGISEDEAQPLRDLLDAWADGYPDSSLVRVDEPDAIVVQDRRAGWAAVDHRLDDPLSRAVYQATEPGRSLPAVRREVAAAGLTADETRLRGVLDDLLTRGLVFVENGQWLALATATVPIKVG